MTTEPTKPTISPTAFMRSQRPELYSDTVARTAYRLDRAVFDHHLEGITKRNETHAFEIFCRKLCEQVICPNLRPSTGPEGGGDGKVDSETAPVADEIRALHYVGVSGAAQERWAFAFSAKQDWRVKVRRDCESIFSTGRPYRKIVCVTSQYAPSKKRLALEDELSGKYGIPVVVHDRTWLIQQIIEEDRRDLAFHYLGVGEEFKDPHRLGPNDYSRTRHLEDIERQLRDPKAFDGMERQRVTEALVAAKLSCSLERPRSDTDGRFARAIRLAESDGTFAQQLAAHYEQVWMAFWWFDDVALLNANYDAFERRLEASDLAGDWERLCDLGQLLFNSVIHEHLNIESAQLNARIARLRTRLEEFARDVVRPNNALEAETSLIVLDINEATIARDPQVVAAAWPKLVGFLHRARGLGEFDANRLVRLIEALGAVAGDDVAYTQLVEELAVFVAERSSEIEGALVLLKRARQLGMNKPLEVIRLTGKAAFLLTKRENTADLVEAATLLAIAYQSIGMHWAARSMAVLALGAELVIAHDEGDIPASIAPRLVLLTWTCLALRHLPDALVAFRVLRGCATTLPFDDASLAELTERFSEIDMELGGQLLRCTPDELQRLADLPEVLGRLGLTNSRAALLFVLGYEATLRDEGWADDRPSEELARFFSRWAGAATQGHRSPSLIGNDPAPPARETTVLGMRVSVLAFDSELGLLVAETLLTAVEVVFATLLELSVLPHAEAFSVVVVEGNNASTPTFAIDAEELSATVMWPEGLHPNTYGNGSEVQPLLVEAATMVMVATCMSPNMKATVERVIADEAVLHRIALAAAAGNSYQRVFQKPISRLGDWLPVTARYPPLPERPNLRVLESAASPADRSPVPPPSERLPKTHSEMSIHSVIDVTTWTRAGWKGAGFLIFQAPNPPVLMLLFQDEAAGRRIFERWRERVGEDDVKEDIYVALVRQVDASNPLHYRVLITSNPERVGKLAFTVLRRLTMHAQTDVHLQAFLSAYDQAGEYFLVPAAWSGAGAPTPVYDVAIRKRQLSVRNAGDIGEHEMEAAALGSEPSPD